MICSIIDRVSIVLLAVGLITISTCFWQFRKLTVQSITILSKILADVIGEVNKKNCEEKQQKSNDEE